MRQYQPDAVAQLEAITDPLLYNDLADACDIILLMPGNARASSTVLTTERGHVWAYPVPGRRPWRVFWSAADPIAPVIEAVFQYET